MKLACILFHRESKARKLCEEVMEEILENGEFIVDSKILKSTLLDYIVKRLEREGVVVVYRRRGERTVRITLSDEARQDIVKAYTALMQRLNQKP